MKKKVAEDNFAYNFNLQIQIIETWDTKKRKPSAISLPTSIHLPSYSKIFILIQCGIGFILFRKTVSICRHIICERTRRNTKDRIFRYSHRGRKIGKSRVIIVCLMGSQWLFLMRHEGNCGYKLHTFSGKSFKVTTN